MSNLNLGDLALNANLRSPRKPSELNWNDRRELVTCQIRVSMPIIGRNSDASTLVKYVDVTAECT